MKSTYELFGLEIGPGWRSLVEPLIARCQAEGVTILQIKEKFGGLRFYVSDGSEALIRALDVAEAKSCTICEECGAPGERRGGGWIRTLCDFHAEDRIL